MQAEGHFERNAQALFRRIVNRTTAQVVDHAAAGVQVVVIVVLASGTVIDVGRHAAPLGIVSGTFQVSGESAGLSVALNVPHTATEAHGIGAYHALLLALVAQYHHAIVVGSLVELKVSEVHPGASTYLLVHFEFGDSTLVEDEVLGIAHAFG